MKDPIKSMDFCVTSSRKGLRGSGLELGQKVLVVGVKPLPEKRNDPYLQRIYSLVVLVEDDKICLPNADEGVGDNGYRTYLIDPRCLTKLGEDDQVELSKLLGKHK